MNSSLHAARVALALAGVDLAAQARVLLQLELRLDRQAALSRRDHYLREAFELFGAHPGNVRLLADAINRYASTVWPCVRHLPDPRPDDRPLYRAFFRACQAAEDAGAAIPGARQIRRVVT